MAVTARTWALVLGMLSRAATAVPAPRSILLDYWGVKTKLISESDGHGTTSSFRQVSTIAWNYERGYLMQALANDAPDTGSVAQNDSVVFAIASNLSNREGGSYTYLKKLGVCFICPLDISVYNENQMEASYLASALRTTNVTVRGVTGCEEWYASNDYEHHFFVLPTGANTGRLIEHRQMSPSYNATVQYDYWWTSAPDALFDAQFAQWKEWNSSLLGCYDRRHSSWGCLSTDTVESEQPTVVV